MNSAPPRVRLLGDASLCREFAEVFADRIVVVSGDTGEDAPADIGLEVSVAHDPGKEQNLRALERSVPFPGLLLTNVVACPLSEQVRWLRAPGRLLGIGLLPSVLRVPLFECVRSNAADDVSFASFQQFAATLGRSTTFVGDVPGLVHPRIRSMILNEAFFALEEHVATRSDIDLAMRLGTNYPTGPFAWGQAVGLQNVVAILLALQRFYGDERYRPAPLLREAVRSVRCG